MIFLSAVRNRNLKDYYAKSKKTGMLQKGFSPLDSCFAVSDQRAETCANVYSAKEKRQG